MPSQFGSRAAARVGDPVTHSAALWGLLEGALVGAALGAILVASGGTAAPLLIAGAMATGASRGGTVGKIWGEHHVTPCGTIVTGSPNVNVNGKPAAFASSLIVCSQHPGPQMVAEGSASVNINGRPAARVGDHGTCGCVIAPPGSPNVFTGGAPVSALGYAGEVPWYADAALLVLGLAGGGALLAVKGLGSAAIALKLGGQFFGGELGASGGHALGGRLFGEGTRGQTLLTFGGALVGGLGGEGLGGSFAASRAARAAGQAAMREGVLANVAASQAARAADLPLGNAAEVVPTARAAADGSVGRIDYGRNFEQDLRNFTPGSAVLHSGPLPEDVVLVNYHNADVPIGYFPGQPSRSLMWWTPADGANGMPTVDAVQNGLALPSDWGPRNGVAIARNRFRAFDPAWIVDSRRIP